MIATGFDRIHPTPQSPKGSTKGRLLKLKWTSKSKIAINFKDSIKTQLRAAQLGRCCYCRRVLFDDYATHIEHFVDKDNFPEYAFEILNLALSCGTCNSRKNGYFVTWRKKARIPALGIPPDHCPVAKPALPPGTAYPAEAKFFRWVNPHLHNYSEHIKIKKGWIFTPISREGRRTVKGIRLNEIGLIEKRALIERMELRGGRISMLTYAISELSTQRASVVAKTLASAIIRRRRIRKERKRSP